MHSAITAILVSMVCFSGLQAKLADPPHLSAIPTLNESQNWSRQAIGGFDRPDITAAGSLLDKLFADGGRHLDVLKQCREQSLKDPSDSLKLYKWGYASYLNERASEQRSTTTTCSSRW